MKWRCILVCCSALAGALGYGQGYVEFHVFTNTDTGGSGAGYPMAGVTFDTASNMFGTFHGGGANHYGIVWEITSGGGYKDLHDFGGAITDANGQTGADGHAPLAGVTVAAQGDLYGTCALGGANWTNPSASGIAWEITASGEYKDLHDFGGTVTNANGQSGPDGCEPEAGVTFDPAGDLVGTCYCGPSQMGSGMLWEITAGGAYMDLHDFGGHVLTGSGQSVLDGANPISDVRFDASGDLFGTCSAEGAGGFNAGLVWEITLGLTIAPATVTGGSAATGTIYLPEPAPSAGLTASLVSNSSSATVPASINFSAGQASATFTVTTSPVSSATPATITATVGSLSATAQLTVNAPALSSLSLTPSTL